MKTRFYILLAAVLCLAACNKDKEELRHERDIVYTVAEETTTVHLETEAEWHQLLDHFCDYAEGGCSVTFRNAKVPTRVPPRRPSPTAPPTARP